MGSTPLSIESTSNPEAPHPLVPGPQVLASRPDAGTLGPCVGAVRLSAGPFGPLCAATRLCAATPSSGPRPPADAAGHDPRFHRFDQPLPHPDRRVRRLPLSGTPALAGGAPRTGGGPVSRRAPLCPGGVGGPLGPPGSLPRHPPAGTGAGRPAGPGRGLALDRALPGRAAAAGDGQLLAGTVRGHRGCTGGDPAGGPVHADPAAAGGPLPALAGAGPVCGVSHPGPAHRRADSDPAGAPGGPGSDGARRAAKKTDQEEATRKRRVPQRPVRDPF